MERLALDPLDAAVLAVCAAPELNPAYGRLYAYLHDDVTRKLPSAGLVARLVAGGGVTPGEVLARFARDAPLRRLGALRLIDERGQTPIADRAVKVADPVAALLLGADLDETLHDGRLRREPIPATAHGRDDALAGPARRWRPATPTCRSWWSAPTPPACWPPPSARPS